MSRTVVVDGRIGGRDAATDPEPNPVDAPDTQEGPHGSAGADELRQLLGAVMVIGSELDLGTVLQRIAETATTLVGAAYGALGVLDADRVGLSDFIAVGIDPATRAEIGHLPRGHGILGRLIVDPRPLRLPDLSRHPDSCGFPPHHPRMTSFLGAPVMIRGQVFGNLYLCDKAGGGVFTDADEELVVSLASAAGIAIDNARLHARVADVMVMEDRDRIARDLHDTVIQRLFAIGLSLESAARLAEDPRAAERMHTAVDDLDTTIKEIRTAIFELHSSRSPVTSTRQSVLDLTAEATRNLGFEPTTRLDGPIDTVVVDDLAVHALAVLREALANVARHAHARAVEVRVVAGPDELVLEVVDDGIGPPADPDVAGHGLRNMADRAAEVGGTCELLTGESGAVLRWTAPLA